MGLLRAGGGRWRGVGGGGAVEDLGPRRVGGLLRVEQEAGAVGDGRAAGRVPLPEQWEKPVLVGGAAPIRGGAAGAGAESILVEDLSIAGATGDAALRPDMPSATSDEVGGEHLHPVHV